LRPVNLAATAAVGNGVSAQITSLEAIHGTGIGPGNISGPALRVTVVVHNGTAAPVSLDGVSVEMTSGDDLQPAPPLDDPSQRPLAGMVGPGKAEQGAYVFRISEDRRSSVTVTVGYQAGAPIMVFTGAAG
jgi:large exoprotein involved in heme utilization and adhesion